MDDYIKRNVAINVIANAIIQGESLGMSIAEDILYDVPSEDVQPVWHGHWIGYAGTIGNECSICHTWLDVMQGTAEMNFCPNCGARMDGEQNDD